MKRILIGFCLLVLAADECGAQKSSVDNMRLLRPTVFALTNVMLHDGANPPAAARFYAYAMLAGYEVIRQTTPGYDSLKNKLRSYPVPSSQQYKDVDVSFSALYAIAETGRQIMPSGQMLEANLEELYKTFLKKGVSKKVLDRSMQFAITIAGEVIAFSKTDGYFKLSTFPKYQPQNADGTWYPTPPDYMAAIEPYWKTVRPFFITDSDQFKPVAPAAFSTDANSRFYRYMNEVYDAGKHLTDEQRLIATYWDCNPFAVHHSGHMNIGIKKISPGGHWMNIAGQVCEQANHSLAKAIYVQTVVAMTLHDAFISCWDEKYRSDRIRPQTAINKYLDEKWEPILQTPPFPEYTSGHSVISSAVAVVLTHFFGNGYKFTDKTEIMFGMPERSFTSFSEASSEAAISRLYGGIHYRDAIEEGQRQGKSVGAFIVSQIKK